MTCQACIHYLPSDKANAPRPGLAGYGYCKAAASTEDRARFFRESHACWLVPGKFTPIKREAV